MPEDRLKRLLVRYNIGYRLLALLLAVLLWFFVAGQNNPLVQRTITVPVGARSLSAGMVLVEPLGQVRVTVRGFKRLVQALDVGDLIAYVDLSHGDEGVNFTKVHVRVPQGIELLSVTPESVRVQLDKVVEKKVPVRVDLKGTPAPGFTALSPEVTPAEITLSGPSRILQGIQTVRAEVSLDGLRENLSQRVQVKVSKASGGRLEIHPTAVEVLVPVAPVGPVKTVQVTAVLQGKPREGYLLKEVSTDPAAVELTGTPQAMAGLSQVQTRPVDITDAHDQVTQETELALPPGVYQVKPVKIRVNVLLFQESGQPSNQQ